MHTTRLEEANHAAYKTEVHEISPGIIYRHQNVKVTAFRDKDGS